MATVAIEDRVSRIELALEANARLDRSAEALLVASLLLGSGLMI